ncbi:MAG: hypothetical protein RR988_03815, partial [Clostridia bacterium]
MKAKKAKIKKDREMYSEFQPEYNDYLDEVDTSEYSHLTLEELDADIEEMEIEMYGKRISPPLEEL